MQNGACKQFWTDVLRLWGGARAWVARVPRKGRVVLAVFLVAAAFLALHTALSAKTATLHLKVQHGLRSVQMSVWVDGELAYSGQIMGVLHKRLGLIPDSVQRTWSQRVPVSPGKHWIRVRMASEEGSVQENAINGEFVRDGERDLAVSERRSFLLLSWQTSGGGVAHSSLGLGLGRYAGTLLLTIAGSIVSALTGYVIRELPKKIVFRQEDVPKS